MNVLKDILVTLRPGLRASVEKRARLKEIDDAIIAAHSNGNIFLQIPKYYTRKQLDKELQEVTKYNF